jgi:heat shock protein HspQ
MADCRRHFRIPRGSALKPAVSGRVSDKIGHRLFPVRCFVPIDKAGGSGLVTGNGEPSAMLKTDAKYHIGQVLRHRKHPFRGVVFDVDAMFSNTQDWYEAIPEDARPAKNQPFYHLLAENDQSYYVAYVSEQNLVPDETGEPVSHPDLPDLFGDFEDGRYPLQFQLN